MKKNKTFLNELKDLLLTESFIFNEKDMGIINGKATDITYDKDGNQIIFTRTKINTPPIKYILDLNTGILSIPPQHNGQDTVTFAKLKNFDAKNDKDLNKMNDEELEVYIGKVLSSIQEQIQTSEHDGSHTDEIGNYKNEKMKNLEKLKSIVKKIAKAIKE